MNMRSNFNSAQCDARTGRAGFTLVEILVVIAIIGLLAAASLVALSGARGFFRSATAKTRLDDVGRALELYKQKFGEYPPDCRATDQEIRRHILKRWPKALRNSAGIGAMVAAAKTEMRRTPGSAALFWLAGFPEDLPVAGSTEITRAYYGFFADPVDPFGLLIAAADKDSEPRIEPILELTYDSTGKNNGNYNDAGFVFNGQVMAYFRAEPRGGYEFVGAEDTVIKDEIKTAWGAMFATTCEFPVPYMKDGRWFNPDSYQLILPGEDGSYGGVCGHTEHEHEHGGFEPRDVNDPDSISLEDWDNITNFTDGATLDTAQD
jgi:prepilin-type N-terminal cleavage/methylation domain-containing protein